MTKNTKVVKSSKGAKKGERRGGRIKGTPNKRTQNLIDLINTKYPGFDPIISLIAIAQSPETPIDIVVNCLKEVAKYIHPQRKAVEVVATEENMSMTEFMQGLAKVSK